MDASVCRYLATTMRADPFASVYVDGRMAAKFYTSLGSFASGALIALVGGIVTMSVGRGALTSLALVGLSGAIGVTGLVTGCAMMVQETRIAVRTLVENNRHQRIDGD